VPLSGETIVITLTGYSSTGDWAKEYVLDPETSGETLGDIADDDWFVPDQVQPTCGCGLEGGGKCDGTLTIPASDLTSEAAGTPWAVTREWTSQANYGPDGRLGRGAAGYLTYTAYDQATGAVVKRIVDVDTSQTDTFADKPAGWTTPGGGGRHLTTTYEVDSQGRVTKETDANGNVTYTRYNDASGETRIYRGWYQVQSNPPRWTTTAPIEVTREDRTRGYVETLTLASGLLFATSSPGGDEPFTMSDVRSLGRTFTNAAQQTTEIRRYFHLGGLTYSPDADWERGMCIISRQPTVTTSAAGKAVWWRARGQPRKRYIARSMTAAGGWSASGSATAAR